MLKELLIEIPLAIIGTIGFSILFGTSKKLYLPCGINGGISWLVYRLVFALTASTTPATFIAAVALATTARGLAVHYKAPTVIFLYGGIFTLVPGAGIYAIAYQVFLGTTLEGFMSAGDTLKTAVAIALGIGVSYMLPAKIFGWGRHSSRTTSES